MRKVSYFIFATLLFSQTQAMLDPFYQHHQNVNTIIGTMFIDVLSSFEMPKDSEIQRVANECYDEIPSAEAISMIFKYNSPEYASGNLKDLLEAIKAKLMEYCEARATE